ncbi:FAD binding domain-containing protein [Aspergillus sclerotialis]|uniref:FAD binding domain-containing protein n=1 Tax=Aspergillus sclerotialis TaxID=2070753 RepID=A0A3A2ZU34_9EURO|nr:FAD binding domain-containing protein [Aspergillus sclerotialis]
MKGIRLVDNFTPEGAPADKGEGRAVTIDAGVSLRELYTAIGAQNRTVVAGAANTVGPAGGYIQGGGHSFLGPWKGLASDNALEFTVVTADLWTTYTACVFKGKLVTANEYQNGDLYWALRGGGGGTFGIVVNVTLHTFDEMPVIFTSFNITTSYGDPNYCAALAHFHAAIPGLNDANGAGYYYITPYFPLDGNVSASVLTGYMIFPNQTDPARVQGLLKPLFLKLNSLAGVKIEHTFIPFPSIRALIGNIFLRDNDDATGKIRLLGSRLISRNLLSSIQGTSRLVSTLRHFEFYPGRHPLGRTPGVAEDGVHMFIERTWDTTATLSEQEAVRRNLTNVEVPLLRSIEGSQAMGAYLNEANAYETDFQASFWGDNYPRLYKIRQKWDPTGLFIVRRGVGSEDWDEEGFCRCT